MKDRRKDGIPPPVETLRETILQNYSDPEFDLEQSIRSIPLHYDYMRKVFKKETGRTPLAYLNFLRMKKAEELLIEQAGNRNMTISAVAEECGFSDGLYFSRVFKKHFGCSPTRFMEKID